MKTKLAIAEIKTVAAWCGASGLLTDDELAAAVKSCPGLNPELTLRAALRKKILDAVAPLARGEEPEYRFDGCGLRVSFSDDPLTSIAWDGPNYAADPYNIGFDLRAEGPGRMEGYDWELTWEICCADLRTPDLCELAEAVAGQVLE